jgi:glycine oxidase
MRVLIIGAGVAGLAIGWRLRQAGADVTVFDRAQPGMGATWASAGMIAAGGELGGAQSPDADFARLSSSLWEQFAADVEEASGRAIGYQRGGALLVARTAREAAELHPWPGTERIDAARALAIEPMLAPNIVGGLWAADEAKVNSRALGVALAHAFIRAGGKLIANEAIVHIKIESSGAVAAATPFASYAADAFILAAGAWSGTIDGLSAQAVPPVKPIKGQILAVAPPPGRTLPSQIIWGNGIYMVPREQRLLIGATSEDVGFDTSVTDSAADFLSARARALAPELGTWEIVERWAGLRPGSPDGLPLLGRTIVTRLFVASGQYRNGILFAPAIARLMCDIVLERDIEIPAFDPRRFLGGR